MCSILFWCMWKQSEYFPMKNTLPMIFQCYRNLLDVTVNPSNDIPMPLEVYWMLQLTFPMIFQCHWKSIGCYRSPFQWYSNAIGSLLDVTVHSSNDIPMLLEIYHRLQLTLAMIFQYYWKSIGSYSSEFQWHSNVSKLY